MHTRNPISAKSKAGPEQKLCFRTRICGEEKGKLKFQRRDEILCLIKSNENLNHLEYMNSLVILFYIINSLT